MTSNNKIVVFDIDGTLANVDHRRQYVATKPKNWKAFNAGIVNDTPHDDIVWLAKLLWDAGHTVVLCSGRGEENRAATETQMAKFNVPYGKLYMRPAGDNRKDSIVKVELLQQIRKDYGEPFMWFDDRQQVVDAIRAEGIRVMQVAPGDF
jgi:hypothetical protein